jgi:three-Cys-motif partner protein
VVSDNGPFNGGAGDRLHRRVCWTRPIYQPSSISIAALDAARAALALCGHQWKAGDIHCVFIEAVVKRFNHLQSVVDNFGSHNRIKVHLFPKTFTEGLAQLRAELPRAFSEFCPLFVFIDPFGATGVPFSAVADILKSPRSEVLINFDADGIARIYRAAEDAKSDVLLGEVFGNNLWKAELAECKDFSMLYRQVLSLYKQNLRRLPNIKYDFAFEMCSSGTALNYYLVFASQYYLGLEKMKEAMKKVDQTGSYHFSDAHVNQPTLLRFDKPENYSGMMYNNFKGRCIRYEEVRDFALNETPFINPKGMLKDFKRPPISSSDPKRRRGTFNEDKIEKITFKGDNNSVH